MVVLSKHTLLVVLPPLSAVAVPPVTVLAKVNSALYGAGQAFGVIGVAVQEAFVVRPVFHLIVSVLAVLLSVIFPCPPVIAVLLQPVALAFAAPVAVGPPL
jgi:hypothetical protein